MVPSCVVLFDIDGTLLTNAAVRPSAGVFAMGESAKAVTGLEKLHQRVEFAGRTDRQIARDLLTAAGEREPAPEKIDVIIQRYLEALERHVHARPYRSLGRVREAVLALRAQQMTVGLGTGNVRRGAQLKLGSAGILDLFDLALGGYGDDADTRAEVLEIGAKRCDPSRSLPVVIVGDTPHDVRAALDIGAKCVAVPTGLYDAASLESAGAHVLVDSLDEKLDRVVMHVVQGPR